METGKLILKILREYTDRIFIVSGTDYPAFIKAQLEEKGLPEFEVALHEIVASSAAIGYSLGGKLGVLFVHTIPGTFNSLGFIANAFTSRIPLLVIAGKSPYTERGSTASKDLRIHWTQDADQEGFKFFKWSFEVRHPSQVEPALRRAIQIALSEPQGPVYLVIPREISVSEAEDRGTRMEPFYAGVPESYLQRAKEMIERASNPVIVTWRAGRRESWFKALRDFADRANIPVLNYVGERVNYPSSGKMAIDHFDLREADLIIEVEVDVPWIPKKVDVDAKVIRVDAEPSYSYIPFYGFSCDLCVQSAVDEFFNRLNVKRELDKSLQEEIFRQREEKRKNLEKLSSQPSIHPNYLSYEVCKLGWTVFNEYDLNPKYCSFEEFNSYFGDPAFGHLGWAMGAGVGYKMATKREVVVAVGDGSFIFGEPLAFYHLQRRYPVLTVIFDNKAWNAVQRAVKEVYPGEKFDSFPGAEIDIGELPSTIEKVGGKYFYVERAEEVEGSLRKAKEEVERGRPAIVHAKVVKT
ncbi:MAG: thiamine pyrophosphate-requiring protein [Candidatus Aramenus sp.]|nr:thiamine pyrophosphate-requiring protein [Candidatus Aramenus sp.]